MHAATYGHSGVARVLIDNGAQIDAADEAEETPLHHVASNGPHKVTRLLTECGAKLDAVNKDQRPPLMCAASNGSVSFLLRYVRKIVIRH